MPIKDPSLYPDSWPEIRAAILKRAKNRCEGSPKYPFCRAVNGKLHFETRSKVVLTVAHMDHNPRHNEPLNLRALCQRCHLDHDRFQHLLNSAKTREAKKGNQDLFPRGE